MSSYSASYDSKKSDDSNGSGRTDSSGFTPQRFSFPFPPPPRLCRSVTSATSGQSDGCRTDSTASSASEGCVLRSRRRGARKRQVKRLPPIGVFWDIENCQVPKNKSAASIVQRIREFFFEGYREADFIVACDVRKENPQVVQDLHDAQVNLIHVSSTSKNAADEKLKQSLRRFAETHSAPATVVLISGDINYTADLSDLRYRKKIHVILVHNSNVADALILCANETYTYTQITDNLPVYRANTTQCVDLLIQNLPSNYEKKVLKNRLKLLSDNCGGRVLEVDKDGGTAKIRFSTIDFATRAQRRLNGEDVFGKKISVSNGASDNDWRARSPKNFGRKLKSTEGNFNSGYQSQDSFLGRDNPRRSYPEKKDVFRGRSNEPWKSFARPKTPIDTDPNVNPFSLIKPIKGNSEVFSSMNSTFDNPIENASSSSSSIESIELYITNLDATIKDLRKVLLGLLTKHAVVYSLNLCKQPDGNPMATVKVASQQDAQNVISQVHHHKLGFKRLSIEYAQTNTLDPAELKEMVIALLQDAPLNSMALFRLLNLLEERFLMNVSVSDINKLKDICRITDENGERIISLTSDVRTSPLPGFQRTNTMFCSVHCPNGIIEDYPNFDDDMLEVLHVRASFKPFAAKLNLLLSSHMGTLPLLSFAVCYKHEFGEPLPIDPNGVPLEHLITCVSNVQLKYGGSNQNTKYIVRKICAKTSEDKETSFMKSLSPSITANISLLSRELVDLLKTTERCQLQLNKYIPAYHHHFGRQLRVADYGYTKLSDLLYSSPISNVVQILGEGSKRIITLTHPTQMRRFTSDLLRVLKVQVAKQLFASEFSAAYERALNKTFNAIEYGLCTLEDLLEEVPDNVVVISKRDDQTTISIPKREQTPVEVVRMKQFADEAIKLLSYSPQCSMLFNKFVPAYHHHFGHQCKVSDYGFTKLIELFEAIPETLKVEELPNGDRKVCLTLPKALNHLGNQISDLIRKSYLSCIPLESLQSAFYREFGHQLKPQYYECKGIDELIDKLSDYIKVTYSSAGMLLVLVESDVQSTIALRVWGLLIKPPHYLDLNTLINVYNVRYQSNINVQLLEQLNNVIINKGGESIIFLTPHYATAAKIYLMLYEEGGQIPYNTLESLYRKNYGVSLFQQDEDVHEKLFTEFNFLVVMRRIRKKTNIALNPKITDYGLPLPTSTGCNVNPCVKMDEQESASWPPPPIHRPLYSNARGATPPKPDTPPTSMTALWNNWDSPSKLNNSMEFSIPLPAASSQGYAGLSESLISPTKYLLSADMGCVCRHSLVQPMIASPHPAELPMPDKLLKKNPISDDSTDSGVHNSQVVSENEMDNSSCEQNGAKPKTRNFQMELLYKF